MRRVWRRVFISFALAVLLCGWLLHRAIRQEQLDRELIQAIRLVNSERVASLLAQGADPNAREKPVMSAQANSGLWQRIRALFHPIVQDRSPYRSALWIASRQDFATHPFTENVTSALDVLPNSAKVETIIGTLLHAGAKPQTDTAKVTSALAWAERYWRSLPKEPVEILASPGQDDYFYFRYPIENILSKYGPSADTYTLIARWCLQADYYAEAAHYARIALLLRPSKVEAQTLRAESERLEQIAKSISSLLPAGTEILHLRPYSIRPNVWAVVSAKHDDEEKLWYSCKSVLLTLFQEHNGQYKKLWQGGAFRKEGDVYEVNLFLVDLTDDGIAEIVLYQRFPGATFAPHQIDVFAWRKETLESIPHSEGTAPLWLEDPKGNHHYIVYDSSDIGVEMRRAEQPSWSNLYEYRNGRFCIANADYPAQFVKMRKELRETLKKYPHDYECRKYLAYIETIQGDKTGARQDYARAAQDCARQIPKATYPEERRELRRTLRELPVAQKTLPVAPPKK